MVLPFIVRYALVTFSVLQSLTVNCCTFFISLSFFNIMFCRFHLLGARFADVKRLLKRKELSKCPEFLFTKRRKKAIACK